MRRSYEEISLKFYENKAIGEMMFLSVCFCMLVTASEGVASVFLFFSCRLSFSLSLSLSSTCTYPHTYSIRRWEEEEKF